MRAKEMLLYAKYFLAALFVDLWEVLTDMFAPAISALFWLVCVALPVIVFLIVHVEQCQLPPHGLAWTLYAVGTAWVILIAVGVVSFVVFILYTACTNAAQDAEWLMASRKRRKERDQ